MKNPITRLLAISLLLFAIAAWFKYLDWRIYVAFGIAYIVAYLTALVQTIRLLLQMEDTDLVSKPLWIVLLIVGPWWGIFAFLYVHRHEIDY